MLLLELEKLNKNFSINNESVQVFFKKGAGDIPVVEIKNTQASARISLQGAHLLSWIPQAEDEVIWLSPEASFKRGKSIRGGIPVCWPWFGAHESNSDYPAHGFARTVTWNVCDVVQLESGETRIKFSLDMQQLNSGINNMWPVNTRLEYIITIGTMLKLELITHNEGAEDCIVGEALHSYFNVGNIKKTKVLGLDNIMYLDKPDNFKCKQQHGDVGVSGEVDRVYLNSPDMVMIHNQNRKIIIKTQGSQSTIVWNPGKKVAEEMADLGENGYLKMLCVESGNAASNVVSIAAGKSHALQVTYQIESY